MKIITVTLSPALDVHCHAESFNAERENFAKITSRDAGGKGINISRALLSCGIKSRAIVAVGDKNADGFLSALAADGLDCEAIWTDGLIRENITVHTEKTKETRLSFDGFCGSSALLGNVESCVNGIAESGDILALAGSVPSGIGIENVKAFALRLKSKGVRVAIDSRSFSPADIFECAPFLIKPNEEEIITYVGNEITSTKEAIAAAESIREKGVENVMISLGARGAALASAEGCFFAEAPKLKALSTIGAGDSSIAGFLVAFSEKRSADECLKNAIAYGSAACLSEGTKPPTKGDVERLLSEIKIERI